MKIEKKISYHVAGWSLFMAYEVIANFVLRGHLSSFADIAVHYLTNIILFYFISDLLLPAAFKSGKIKIHLFIIYIVPVIAVYAVLVYWLDLLLSALHFEISWPVDQPKLLITAALFRAIYILGLSAGYWFAIRYFRSLQKNFELIRTQMADKAQKLQLEKAFIRSENAFLQAQINPHLLFNTLNYIYNSVEEVSANAAEAVMLLADISRYSMRPPDEEGLAYLTDELEQIQKLIRLNRLRFNGKIYIDYKAEGDFKGLRIAPLILLGFAENLFKHGDCSDNTHPATIRVRMTEEMLSFTIDNRKSKRSRISHVIGMENTQMRLDTIYGGKYLLDIIDEPEYYSLNLCMKLDYAELLYS